MHASGALPGARITRIKFFSGREVAPAGARVPWTSLLARGGIEHHGVRRSNVRHANVAVLLSFRESCLAAVRRGCICRRPGLRPPTFLLLHLRDAGEHVLVGLGLLLVRLVCPGVFDRRGERARASTGIYLCRY